MPYIQSRRREQLDPIVDLMGLSSVVANGDLNYILYAFYKKYRPIGYNNIKNYCAELRACATEIERTILGPYEDKKREENGDI